MIRSQFRSFISDMIAGAKEYAELDLADSLGKAPCIGERQYFAPISQRPRFAAPDWGF